MRTITHTTRPGSKRDETAAVITIKRAADMTRAGRRRVAKWLRQNADFLEEHGAEYDQAFRARYIYTK